MKELILKKFSDKLILKLQSLEDAYTKSAKDSVENQKDRLLGEQLGVIFDEKADTVDTIIQMVHESVKDALESQELDKYSQHLSSDDLKILEHYLQWNCEYSRTNEVVTDEVSKLLADKYGTQFPYLDEIRLSELDTDGESESILTTLDVFVRDSWELNTKLFLNVLEAMLYEKSRKGEINYDYKES